MEGSNNNNNKRENGTVFFALWCANERESVKYHMHFLRHSRYYRSKQIALYVFNGLLQNTIVLNLSAFLSVWAKHWAFAELNPSKQFLILLLPA